MKADDLSDADLLSLVLQADKRLFDKGHGIKRRSLSVAGEVMRHLGIEPVVIMGVGKPAIVDRIFKAFEAVYKPEDLAIGGHIGVFMFRDVFARIALPRIFGTVQISPMDSLEVTAVQRQLIQGEHAAMRAYLDQFSDVFDVEYGVDDLSPRAREIELVGRFLGLAKLHLQSAAAVLTGRYDHRGAVQSALLATELALKAGPAGLGLTEIQIKDQFGHKFGKMADFLGHHYPEFDLDRVQRVISLQPQYVANRYAAEQPPLAETGHLVMGAQYIVSEVVRQFSDQDFRKAVRHGFGERSYPA